ncbi:MAG: pyridoxamine 5'-phosphate oxidase family protein [Kofleriaceae bacterium]|nr:pyridoxamine 5'-phosphate oxidase family protein [Kofleriaceae bacterium]
MIRELQTAEIDRLLRSEIIGRLGFHARGRTDVVPITYVFDGKSIIGHTGLGHKVMMMRENPSVCFEVDHIDRTGGWESVLVHGEFQELHDDDATHALDALLDHIAAFERLDKRPVTHGAGRFAPGGGERPEVVFRIAIEDKTGRGGTILQRGA